MENSERSNAEVSKSPRPKTPPPSTSGGKQFISRNPWLNFVSDYRKQNKNLPAKTLVKDAAIAWRAMSQADKAPFIEEAKRQPPRPKRRRRRRSRKTLGKKPQLRRRSQSNSSSTSCSLDKPIRERHHFCYESNQISSNDDD